MGGVGNRVGAVFQGPVGAVLGRPRVRHRPRPGLRLAVLGPRRLLAPRGPREGDRDRAVDDAVKDGVGHGGLAEVVVPLLAGQLTGEDRRAGAVAVFEHFEEVLTLRLGERREAPVVEHEHVDAREAREDMRVAPVGVRQPKLVKEPRHPTVEHTIALTTGLLAEGTGEIRLADAGGTRDEHVVMLGDPAAGGELADERAFEPAARTRVEVLETGLRDAQLGLFQPAGQRAIVAKEMLGIDEHAEALVETERGGGRVLVLGQIRVGHRPQAQGAEPVERGGHHVGSPSR